MMDDDVNSNELNEEGPGNILSPSDASIASSIPTL